MLFKNNYMIINTSGKKKFGDVEDNTNIYFLDPRTGTVEPCFVMGHFYEPGKPNIINLTVLIIPKEDREAPLTSLDTSKFNKIPISFPKNESLVLVGTNPPTLYCTDENYLKEWVKLH